MILEFKKLRVSSCCDCVQCRDLWVYVSLYYSYSANAKIEMQQQCEM